jgi:hypothetical protein
MGQMVQIAGSSPCWGLPLPSAGIRGDAAGGCDCADGFPRWAQRACLTAVPGRPPIPVALASRSLIVGLSPGTPPGHGDKPASLAAWAVRLQSAAISCLPPWDCPRQPHGSSVPAGALVRATEAPWY